MLASAAWWCLHVNKAAGPRVNQVHRMASIYLGGMALTAASEAFVRTVSSCTQAAVNHKSVCCVCILQNVHCPICTPVKEYVRRTRNQGGASGMGPGSVAPSPAQPSSSVTSAPPPGGNDMGQYQQQLGGQQVQQQGGLSGMKRSASSMLDPAAAAVAMPAPAGYPQGMMPVPGGGMMGMVPQQPQQQQRMPYGQQQAYMQQQQQYGMQHAYQQQMQYPPQHMQPMQQPYAQQQMSYGQQQMPYGQQQAYMQQQQMGYGPAAAGMGAAGPPGMGGMVPMANGVPPNGMANGEEQTVKKQKTEADKQQLLAKVSAGWRVRVRKGCVGQSSTKSTNGASSVAQAVLLPAFCSACCPCMVPCLGCQVCIVSCHGSWWMLSAAGVCKQ